MQGETLYPFFPEAQMEGQPSANNEPSLSHILGLERAAEQ